MESYGSDIRGGVLHEGGSLNGRKLPNRLNDPFPTHSHEFDRPHERTLKNLNPHDVASALSAGRPPSVAQSLGARARIFNRLSCSVILNLIE